MGEIQKGVREFLSRNYTADIDLMDPALAKGRNTNAGLTKYAPPSVLTGNPYQLMKRRCIGVFGINPKCHGLEGERAEKDVLISKSQIDAHDFTAYEVSRASYFDSPDPPYNRDHFDRLIERIQVGLLGYKQRNIRDFGQQAFMLDLLPWWSTDVSAVDPKKCRLALAPLAAWKGLIDIFVKELQPLLLVINGASYLEWAEELLETKFTRFSFHSWQKHGRPHYLYGYYGEHPTGIPILMHAQVNYQRGPQSQQQYDKMVSAYQDQSGIDFEQLRESVLRPSLH